MCVWQLAATLRLGLRVNKYVLWVGLAAALLVTRPLLVAKDDDPLLAMRTAAWIASTAFVVVIGARKIRRDYATMKTGKAL